MDQNNALTRARKHTGQFISKHKSAIEKGVGGVKNATQIGAAAYGVARLSAYLGGPEGQTIIGVPLELVTGAVLMGTGISNVAGIYSKDLVAFGVGSAAGWVARKGFEHGLKGDATRIVQIATNELGVKEATNRNDGIPAERYSNGRREPWCANFIAWIHREAGKPIPGHQWPLASVQNMEDRLKDLGMHHLGPPKPGDIIFFRTRGLSDTGSGRHAGIVERIKSGMVHTIEGNFRHKVDRRRHALKDPNIAGYGRVI